MVSRNTTLVPSLGLHIGPACEAGLSTGMRRERVPTQDKDKDKKILFNVSKLENGTRWSYSYNCGPIESNDVNKANSVKAKARQYKAKANARGLQGQGQGQPIQGQGQRSSRPRPGPHTSKDKIKVVNLQMTA